MATGPKKGLNPARKVGSQPNNGGFTTYTIASGYATALYLGDVVKLAADGTIQKAANGDVAVGVFQGAQYIDANGTPQHKLSFPAGFTSTQTIYAKVEDNPMSTFEVIGNAAITSVTPNTLWAANLGAGTATFGLSGTLLDVSAGEKTASPATAMFKVVSVIDVDNRVLEVMLSRHEYRVNDN